ncbi:bifunctional protein-serine/threonine kinase/phosphatase [Thioclava sp. 'Guangxiensis']|uniref:protein kinase domain-containing protein n=1 Tax=Thioclava sp. 'Guangxiensis' TaxID=3149044 RepID=UPI003877F0DC
MKPMRASLKVTLGQLSVAGVKPENQDRAGAMLSDLAGHGIGLVLADGISTSTLGAEAAEFAVTSFLNDYYATPSSWPVETAARGVISAINAALWGQNAALADIERGHVTTFAALVVKDRIAHCLHLGDSRISRVENGRLMPLTRDHKTGRSLDRALGIGARAEAGYVALPVAEGELLVLTTDGVHEHLSPEAQDVALALQDPQEIAQMLVDQALVAGSTDNLTVQVLRVDSLPEADTPLPQDLVLPSLPRAGEMLEGYRIIRQVQSTARSHIYLAETPEGARVALKIPSAEMAEDATFRTGFLAEEWAARRVRSDHVLRVPEPRPRQHLFTVSEWVEGQSLRQWMTDNPHPELAQVRALLRQIVQGVRALHRRNMIHQDLRPENIMIDTEGTVKVIDLGSVAVTGVERTAAGGLGPQAGTYQYTAPEYLSGDQVSWRSDQYAIGVIAYEMLTGRLPYGAQVARIRSRKDQAALRYASARDDESGVPAWVDQALARALHPDPSRRYDALTEFLVDMERPNPAWRSGAHRPLMERNPVLFWQGVSAVLALLCLYLAVR